MDLMVLTIERTRGTVCCGIGDGLYIQEQILMSGEVCHMGKVGVLISHNSWKIAHIPQKAIHNT